MFIPLAIGVIGSAFLAPLINMDYARRAKKFGGKPPAEQRLIPMMCSCWFIAIGMWLLKSISTRMANSIRNVHLRLDFVSSSLLVGTCHGRIVSSCSDIVFPSQTNFHQLHRLRLHSSLQQRKQLPCRFLRRQSRLCTRSENIPSFILGSRCSPVHRTDVPQTWLPMGWNSDGIHCPGLLCYPIWILLLRCQNQETFEIRLCRRRRGE